MNLKRCVYRGIHLVTLALIVSCSSDGAEGGFDLGEANDLSGADSGDLFELDHGSDLRIRDTDFQDADRGRAMVRFVSARSDYVIETALLEFPETEHPDIELSPDSIPEWREVPAGEFEWTYTDRNGGDYLFSESLVPDTRVTFVEYGFTPALMPVSPHGNDAFGFVGVPGFGDDGFAPIKNLTIVNSDPYHERVESILVDGEAVAEFAGIGWGEHSSNASLSSQTQVFEVFYPNGDVATFWMDGFLGGQHVILALTSQFDFDLGVGEPVVFTRFWHQGEDRFLSNPRPERVQFANLTNDEIQFGYNSERLWSVGSNAMVGERPLFPRKTGEPLSFILNTVSGDSFVDVQLTVGPQLLIYTDDGFVRSPRRPIASGGAGLILYNATAVEVTAGAEEVSSAEFAIFDDADGDFDIVAGMASYSLDLAPHDGEVLTMIVIGSELNGYEVLIGFADSTERLPLQ